jgi:ribosomal protein S18 acetylase RimI-like enzyme
MQLGISEMLDNTLFPEFAWVVTERPNEKDVQELRQHLRDYNMAHANSQNGYGIAIFLRDQQRQMIAGISGWLWGECLEIDFLWVKETLRGQGIGKRLVTALEEAAIERGCRQTTLETFSFQAPEFYQKLGYNIFGVIEGFGNHFRKFYMQKRHH